MTHCTCSEQVYSKKEMGREEEEEKVVVEGREFGVVGEGGKGKKRRGDKYVCDLSPTEFLWKDCVATLVQNLRFSCVGKRN